MGCGASAPSDAASPSVRLPGGLAERKFHDPTESAGNGGGAVATRAVSQFAADMPVKRRVMIAEDPPSGGRIGVERMGGTGPPPDEDEDARTSPLMTRVSTKKRSEARMVRLVEPGVQTLDVGGESGRLTKGQLAEIAREEERRRQLLEAKSIRLAAKIAAGSDDEEEEEEEDYGAIKSSLSFAVGRVSNGGNVGWAGAAAGATAPPLPPIGTPTSSTAEVQLKPLADMTSGKDAGGLMNAFGDIDPRAVDASGVGGAAGVLKPPRNALGDSTDDFSSLAPPLSRPVGPSDSTDLSRLAPPPASGLKSAAPSRPPSSKVPSRRQSRYSDISLSGSDEEEGSATFDLPRWCKFYTWNRSKPADLTEFLWRRFDPRTNTIHVLTYRAQDAIFIGYQGDNVAHGMACRLEQYLDGTMDLFGVMHTFLDHETGAYKVLGVLITDGLDVPPQLRRMADYEHFQYSKVDPKDPSMRKFVDALLTDRPPLPQMGVLFTRNIQLARKRR
ncbi:hypothetical protein FOA52_008194 [Chlamydomonas sp. UWO 241]|nr:hypothetical protein FOA52_008194 [Chlamydomonas sp. UWO 241]